MSYNYQNTENFSEYQSVIESSAMFHTPSFTYKLEKDFIETQVVSLRLDRVIQTISLNGKLRKLSNHYFLNLVLLHVY